MRRLAALLLVCALLFAGCGKSPPPITEGFSCTVSLEYDGAAYEGIFTRSAAQSGMLALTSPPSVNGLSMAWEGEEVVLSYGGMTLRLDEEKLPVGAAVKIVSRALDACAAQSSAAGGTIHGELAGTAFVIAFDEQSGFPAKLELPSVPITVTFSAWQKLGETTSIS